MDWKALYDILQLALEELIGEEELEFPCPRLITALQFLYYVGYKAGIYTKEQLDEQFNSSLNEEK